MVVIIDHAQQFTINLDDLESLLQRSELGKATSNGSQLQVGILIGGMFPRHAELVANEHSEGAAMIREAARKARQGGGA